MSKTKECLALVDSAVKDDYKKAMGKDLDEESIVQYLEILYSRYSLEPIEYAASLPISILSNDLNRTINMEIWCHT